MCNDFKVISHIQNRHFLQFDCVFFDNVLPVWFSRYTYAMLQHTLPRIQRFSASVHNNRHLAQIMSSLVIAAVATQIEVIMVRSKFLQYCHEALTPFMLWSVNHKHVLKINLYLQGIHLYLEKAVLPDKDGSCPKSVNEVIKTSWIIENILKIKNIQVINYRYLKFEPQLLLLV